MTRLIKCIQGGMVFGLMMSHCMTKPTKWHLRPVKIQIRVGIRPVWSESLLSAWRNHGSLATHWVHSDDSDTGWTPWLIWIFAKRSTSFCWFCHASAQIPVSDCFCTAGFCWAGADNCWRSSEERWSPKGGLGGNCRLQKNMVRLLPVHVCQ